MSSFEAVYSVLFTDLQHLGKNEIEQNKTNKKGLHFFPSFPLLSFVNMAFIKGTEWGSSICHHHCPSQTQG